MDKQQFEGLQSSLAALGCTEGFDETALLYPETEAWAKVIGLLCDRLRGNCPIEKLVKDVSLDGSPPSSVQRTQQLLEALCIDTTEQQIAGAGSTAERVAFLQYLTEIATLVGETVRGERGREAASRDGKVLSVACQASSDLAGGEVNLFKRYPDVQTVVQAAKERQREDDKPLRQKLEEAQLALQQTESMFEGLGGECEDVDPEALRSVCADLEHSLGAFVAGAAEFHAIYTRELEPWTAGTAPPVVHGVGPLAKEIDAKYTDFRQTLEISAWDALQLFQLNLVLQACSTLKASYEELLQRHEAAMAEEGFMPQMIARGPTMAKELQERTAALTRLSEGGYPKNALATEGL